MKICAGLSLLLIASWAAGAQNQTKSDSPSENPAAARELMKVVRSNPSRTFAEALMDPNIVIGIFEYSSEPSVTGLPAEDTVQFLDRYWAAQDRFNLRMLHLVKTVKGDFPSPSIFVYDRIAPTPSASHGPRIPSFIPVGGSQWLLALQKTTYRSRLACFGDDILTYNFLEDRTFFRLFHYGYGAMCVQWPEDAQPGTEARHVTVVPASIADDLVAIRRLLPRICVENVSADDAAAIGAGWRTLKTPVAKSILSELLGITPEEYARVAEATSTK
jgi:hypothetical protein